jgi:hypothetical protein
MASGATGDLEAIWGAAPSNVFAAGKDGALLHYDGGSWAKLASGTASTIHGLSGTGPSDVWAVGDAGTALHYNGTAFTPVRTGSDRALFGVAASEELVLMVGANDTVLSLFRQDANQP